MRSRNLVSRKAYLIAAEQALLPNFAYSFSRQLPGTREHSSHRTQTTVSPARASSQLRVGHRQLRIVFHRGLRWELLELGTNAPVAPPGAILQLADELAAQAEGVLPPHLVGHLRERMTLAWRVRM